jgi:hypothetical protein
MSFERILRIACASILVIALSNCGGGSGSSLNGSALALHPTMSTAGLQTVVPTPVPTMVDVLTFHNDNSRTGQNLHETQLTPGNVNPLQFGKVAFLPVDGKVDAQPLVVSNIQINGVMRSVVYIATEHDSVYAYDISSGEVIWKSSLVVGDESASGPHGCGAVVPEIGATATPVIDRTAGLIYVVAMSTTASGTDIQRLHALSLVSGAEMLNGPVQITATYPAPGNGGQLTFVASQYKEKAALLLANGYVYTTWSSHCDSSPYSSWVIAFNASTLQQSQVFNAEPSSPPGGYGAFWNSGYGPAADAAGNVYLLTGNGDFDSNFDANGFPLDQDYGNAVLKLAPPAAGSSTLTLVDYFTMHNSLPESYIDQDLGSGGGRLLPDRTDASGQVHHLMVGAGKDTNIYVLDRDNLGKFNPDSDSQIWQKLVSAFPANTDNPPAGVFGGPAYFNNTVYYAAVTDVLRAFPIANAKLASTAATTSSNTFPYPGATPSISANGSQNGIVWAVLNSTTQGVLKAYAAADLGVQLYSSDQGGSADFFGPGSKNTPPTIADGRVFVGTQVNSATDPNGAQNGVAVFGLRPLGSPTALESN